MIDSIGGRQETEFRNPTFFAFLTAEMPASTRPLVAILACSVAGGLIVPPRAGAQQPSPAIIVPSDNGTAAGPIMPGQSSTALDNTTPARSTIHIKRIRRFYRELLLKEKNIANAVSNIDQRQIAAEGAETGSIQSLLKQTPSVNEYQQNIGQGVPVLTVRGVRNSQLAQTLDGIPLQDLISGGQGGFLANNVGSPVTLGQISGTAIYPGVAPPDRQGFATVGGTIAYTTKVPSTARSATVFAGYGSFDTSHAGFEINTGKLGTSEDAPRALLRYNQEYTAGFPDGNSIRSGDMLASVIKPYDDGLSKLTATVIYNRADGYVVTAPVPVPLINANSYSYNFPHSLTYSRQNNKYLDAILGDQTYINPHLIISATLFMLRSSSVFTSYETPSSIGYNPGFPYQATFQVPYFAFGAVGPTALANGASTNPRGYVPGLFTYDPFIFAPAGSDPAKALSYSYGEAAELNQSHTTTIGFTPKANIFLPDNNITIGALIAKESSGATDYMYGSVPVPQQNGYNSYTLGGGIQRTVYSLYAQDRIDLLDNRLHLLPGITATGVYTSNITQQYLQGLPDKLQNFGAVAEPYLGISYDLPYHMVGYASYGKSARFAPATDYSLGSVGSTTNAPHPEIVHLYEAGLRYDTSRLYLNVDTFYQKLTDQFSFFTNYQTLLSSYANTGASQYHGYEASARFRVTHDIELFGNAGYVQSTYLNQFFALDTPFEGQFGYVFKGDPLAGIPNWTGNFGIEYNHGPVSARLSGQYTGSQFITIEPTPVLPLNPLIAPPNPNSTLDLATTPYYPSTQANLQQKLGGYPPIQYFKLPGYLPISVYLSYKMPLHGYGHVQNLKFSLNIHNLLGIHYYQHYYLAPESLPNGAGGYQVTPTYASGFVGIPRSIFLNVSAKF